MPRHLLIFIIDEIDSIYLIGIETRLGRYRCALALRPRASRGDKSPDRSVRASEESRGSERPALTKDRFIAASLMLRRKAILVWVVFSDCTDVPTSESYTALERLDAEGDGRLEGLEGTLNGIPRR